MNNRERFRAAMRFEPLDRFCQMEYGFWPETIQRWREEGLSQGVKDWSFAYLSEQPDVFSHFDLIKFGYILPGQYCQPPFPEEILEETDDYVVKKNSLGAVAKHSKKGASLPQFLSYPVQVMRDYEELSERLQPSLEQRYPSDWERLAKELRNQDHTVLCTHMDGFFATPREIMGVENLLMAFYDEPELVHRIIDDRCNFYMTVYEKAIRDTQPDFAFLWEDMCFKNGPLLSPWLFEEFLLPAYQKLTSFLRGLGVENIIVDSDGDVRQLIPLWLKGGVTGLLPFEVKAGMDVVAIGREYPKLQIFGGIDKHALERSRNDIDKELERVLPPMLRRGGYVVTLDHWVQPEIPLSNFQYYTERVAQYPVNK